MACVVTVESPSVAGYSRALHSQGKSQITTEFSDDEKVELQRKDMEHVLKTLQDFATVNPELAAAMDLEKIGVMGHSLGGAAAAQICRNNVGVKAGMNFDGKLLGENATGPIFQLFATIQCDRPATVLENFIPGVKASIDLSEKAKQLRALGDSEGADAVELEARNLLEEGIKGVENFLDPISEFDTFTAKAGARSYQVVLNGARHPGFSSLHTLAHVVGLDRAPGPDLSMYQSWEKQIPVDQATWAATNRHILSFFSEQLKGIPLGITSGIKIEESI